ncbi:6-hydroxymethylpterin diphosphokinase MptE-like protein [uncultured Brachyspira sp.]|uniref:motility associated factor glycosyltransferase family protein n=1 Tax=uncultured Brachyspira sp. TaxID=221953 RepID=UPI002588D98E|nr:6-hydroxymethylpterin diphosphokinase MptE-like protein [uncultured Brachyspira sp.]
MNISVKLHNALNNDLNNKKSEYKIEKNADGFIIAYKNNRAVHSKYNIENECKRALEKINKNKNLLIIYGYGLGYIIKYLIENIENYFDKKILESLKIIVVVEDDYLFKYSYYNIFNTDKKNIFFIHAEDNIDYINKIVDYKNINGVSLVLLPSLTKEEKDKANKFYEEILNNIEKEFSNIWTNLYFENIWTKNIILNSEYINKSSDISVFKNAFNGFNALLICPGPTLINYIEKIKTHRKNLIIICVDTSYSVLCKNGIIPDFIITVDGGFFNSLDFVCENKKFPYLVMDIACNKIIPKIIYDRTKIMRFTSTDNLGIVEYLKKFTDLSSLTTSSTVATTMIDFAYYTNFNKVLLIGFDNSYPYYQRHIKHALSYEYMINKTSKLKTMESYYFDAIKNNSNINVYPPTEFIFENQIEYFKELKNKYPKMFIGRIKSDAIDINSFKEDIIENFLEDKAREKVLNIAEKLYKIDKKDYIKKAYIELKNILEEFRNILINYKKNDYNEIINIIEKYKEKAPILKNILSAVIIMSERVEADIKKRLDFLISESLKNVNYFLTRINIIIDRL